MKTSEIMKQAHEKTREIKKEFPEVNYRTQFGICLADLYAEIKSMVKVITNLGGKAWSKAGYKRVYINNLQAMAEKLGIELPSTTILNKASAYYDCTDNAFYYNTTPSRKKYLKEVFKTIRSIVNN